MKYHYLGSAMLLALIATGPAMTQPTDVPVAAGLPASDVLGSEDIWQNPTFVGGVINGGPSASSEY